MAFTKTQGTKYTVEAAGHRIILRAESGLSVGDLADLIVQAGDGDPAYQIVATALKTQHGRITCSDTTFWRRE